MVLNYVKYLIAFFTSVYIISFFIDDQLIHDGSRAIVVVLVLIKFLFHKKQGQLFFGLFLAFFSIAEITLLFDFIYNNFSYYVGNISYILSYMCLFNHSIIEMNLKRLFKKFIFHIIVLLGLGSYLFYALYNMINYHNIKLPTINYIIEFSYNLFIILVLLFSFLHYIYHMTKKSLVFFIACFALVFSELIQVSYLFIEEVRILNTFNSLIFVFGFYFVYKYIRMGQIED